jgi:hypothetical protein
LQTKQVRSLCLAESPHGSAAVGLAGQAHRLGLLQLVWTACYLVLSCWQLSGGGILVTTTTIVRKGVLDVDPITRCLKCSVPPQLGTFATDHGSHKHVL